MKVVTGEDCNPPRSLWSRISELDAQIARLGRNQFSHRAALTAERSALLSELRSEHLDPGQVRDWAVRSARSSADAHSPHIPSHSEGGGA